jgi:hypothetical protein
MIILRLLFRSKYVFIISFAQVAPWRKGKLNFLCLYYRWEHAAKLPAALDRHPRGIEE